MQHLNDAVALKNIRLEQGWTYAELAARIRRAAGGRGPDTSTVQRFIEQPYRRVHETTRFRIRQFLETWQAKPTRRARGEQRVSS